uniref:Cystatin 8 n=1 Tax=Equus asinus asinus TaxID=83772 RepID=A0A8C4L480_EQUAS
MATFKGFNVLYPEKNRLKAWRELNIISASNANVRQCLWFALQEYNKESEDKYVFQVVKIGQVKMQVTDRLVYFIDVEIARSNCRKLSDNNENCIVQENIKLEKVVMCSFVVGALPWNGEFVVMKKECADA